jgi:hypothetical protein
MIHTVKKVFDIGTCKYVNIVLDSICVIIETV